MREKILFNSDWRFHLGEDETPFPLTKMPLYYQAKTERMQWGFASDMYDETSDTCAEKWEPVTLPHDYIINQEPNKENNSTLGYFKYENGWYKKRFTLSASDKDKRLTLYFEGIATHSTIYVNGCLMARNFCGYTSFEVDITPIARFDDENIVSVYVDTSVHEGWWYSGGGIYRNVWLVKTELTSVDLWGVYINSQRKDNSTWVVCIETTVRNDNFQDQDIVVKSIVLDKLGNEVATAEGSLEISYKDKSVLEQKADVISPYLWDVESPYLYTVKTMLIKNNKVIDCVENKFGFRTICFDKDKGFFLNGKNVKIKGVCCHEDYGITGKAIPDTVKRLRLEKLKEMGANGYRTAHYPHSEVTMDCLDELGFLVLAETRWFEASEEAKKQLEMLIKRDRNRPSVIIWSIGNEESIFLKEQGKRIAEVLYSIVKKLDVSRPITMAVDKKPFDAPVMSVADIIGVNYNLNSLDLVHKNFPEKPFILSECCAAATTRGWYFETDEARGYIKSYDHSTYDFVGTREDTWKKVSQSEWISGEYQWAGIEHRGETLWPRLCSQSGALDMFLQKKDAFFQNKSHWTDKPLVHILPHWNHNGREGDIIDVWVYTNCDEVTLYLNDISLGTRKIEKHGHGEWKVEYIAGCLVAEGKMDGKVVALEKVETTGMPVKLNLRLETVELSANGMDVAVITCFCTDNKGRLVPDANPYVSFYCNNFGRILGTGSDVSDHTPVSSPDRKMYAGLCSVAVKVGETKGDLKIYAKADGLEGDMLIIPLK